MIDCRELTRMVAAGELEDAPRWRRVTVRLHLLMCRHCRGYARDIDAIGDAARHAVPMTEADESALKRLERTLEPDK